jgi:hypothetical protein
LVEQYTTQGLVRGVVVRMLDVEYINYSIPARFDPATDTVENDDGVNVAIDYDAEQQAADRVVADEVAATVMTWQFKDELSADECDRLVLLNKLLSQQLRGKTVSIGNLKKSLTAGEYADYERSLVEPITLDEILYADGLPDELKRYNIKLRDADFQYNKYEKMNGLRGNSKARYTTVSLRRTNQRAEHLYERALEYLQEQIDVATRANRQDELLRWLDRDVDFSTAGKLSIDADGVPRVKGSRSHHAQDAGLPKLSKRLKREQRVLEILLRSAISCAYVSEVVEVREVPKFVRRELPNVSPERD